MRKLGPGIRHSIRFLKGRTPGTATSVDFLFLIQPSKKFESQNDRILAILVVVGHGGEFP